MPALTTHQIEILLHDPNGSVKSINSKPTGNGLHIPVKVTSTSPIPHNR